MIEDNPPQQARINSAHSILWYIEKATSKKYPKWRNTIITFLYKLFDLANKNYGMEIVIKKIDGIDTYYLDAFVCFFHVRQQHLLLHVNKKSLIFDSPLLKDFKPHEGSKRWAKIFKVTTKEELTSLLDYLKSLPRITPRDYYKSRTIPKRVKDIIWDRERGKCVNCGSTENLCFDHIIPYSKGGTSKDPKNIQILCQSCNLKKGNRKFL